MGKLNSRLVVRQASDIANLCDFERKESDNLVVS